jgi:hypothetical protein
MFQFSENWATGNSSSDSVDTAAPREGSFNTMELRSTMSENRFTSLPNFYFRIKEILPSIPAMKSINRGKFSYKIFTSVANQN